VWAGMSRIGRARHDRGRGAARLRILLAATLRAGLEPLLVRIARRLWRPAPLEAWPGWRFGQSHRGIGSRVRLLVSRSYRTFGFHSLVEVPWYRGSTIALDLTSDLGEAAFADGSCEPNELRFIAALLRSGMTTLDIGANIGWFTLLMAASVGATGRVVAFEPSPRERAVLNANVRRNGFAWVTIRAEALLETRSTASLHIADPVHSGQNTLGSFIYEGVRSVATVAVDAAPLDDLVEELHLDGLDFIKVDVEGAELRVLRGALATLRRYRPVLLLEVQEASLGHLGDDVASLVALLDREDYVICSFDDGSGLATLDPALPLSSNVVAVPHEAVQGLCERGAITKGRLIATPPWG
jgi:FkbM family methyltransferase